MIKKTKFCNLKFINNGTNTISRNSIILNFHVGKVFYVHNGLKFFSVTVNTRMVGYKFGEFCLTRKPFSHKKKKK
jgi:ribosomal protein S19